MLEMTLWVLKMVWTASYLMTVVLGLYVIAFHAMLAAGAKNQQGEE